MCIQNQFILFEFLSFKMVGVLSIIKFTVKLLLSFDSSVLDFFLDQFFGHDYFWFGLALRITFWFERFLANIVWRSVLWNHETVIFFSFNRLIVGFELLWLLVLPNLWTKLDKGLILFHFIFRDNISWCSLSCQRFRNVDNNVSRCSFHAKELIGRFCFGFKRAGLFQWQQSILFGFFEFFGGEFFSCDGFKIIMKVLLGQ
jgi:hypothetical protein